MDLMDEVSKKLEIDDKKVISKSSEHLRLLQVKSSSLQVTEYAKIAICLDIAATNTNTAFSQELAISLLSYGKAKYRKETNIIERILNVTKVADVKSICSSIRVANSKELEENAIRILNEYKASKEPTDSHPQYDAMAVYQTSRMMKVKVNEEKLIDVSHRWLEESKINLKAVQKKGKGDKGEFEEVSDTKENVMPNIKCEEAAESYEEWKKRILAKAYADLKSS